MFLSNLFVNFLFFAEIVFCHFDERSEEKS